MFLISTFMLFSINQPKVSAFSEQIIQKGATGNDVVELQARLQYNGYYQANIDGVYGWTTYWAVKNFQHEFGLDDVDGLVGPKTKDMLSKTTKFYKDWVHQQINSGKRFTHYGGMELKYQVEPSAATMEKAKQGATSQWQQKKPQYQQKQAAPQQEPESLHHNSRHRQNQHQENSRQSQPQKNNQRNQYHNKRHQQNQLLLKKSLRKKSRQQPICQADILKTIFN
jgi:N-acetylmuramoyl-L-alanine amidase